MAVATAAASRLCLAALCALTGLRADAPIEAFLDRAEDLDVSLDEFTREVLLASRA